VLGREDCLAANLSVYNYVMFFMGRHFHFVTVFFVRKNLKKQKPKN